MGLQLSVRYCSSQPIALNRSHHTFARNPSYKLSDSRPRAHAHTRPTLDAPKDFLEMLVPNPKAQPQSSQFARQRKKDELLIRFDVLKWSNVMDLKARSRLLPRTHGSQAASYSYRH